MTQGSAKHRTTKRGWATGLAALLVVQACAAVFFVGDVVADFALDGLNIHTGFEAVVASCLALGIVFGALEMRRALERVRRSEAAVAAAAGILGAYIETQFDRWRLTPAEADVAMLALKGFDVAEIATLRGAATGTVRAQLTRIYSKAGVSSRAQFIALFMEELLDDAGTGGGRP